MKERNSTKVNRHINFEVLEFLRDYPETTLQELRDGITDTLSDLEALHKKYAEAHNG